MTCSAWSVIIVVGHVQDMIHVAAYRIRGTVTVNVHPCFLCEPCSVRHCERFSNPVLLSQPCPAASTDFVDAHVDKREFPAQISGSSTAFLASLTRFSACCFVMVPLSQASAAALSA